MLGFVWLWLTVAGACLATLPSASTDLDPRRADADVQIGSTFVQHPPTDLLSRSGSLLDQGIPSSPLHVGAAELSARESFVEGQGTMVAISGSELRHPSGNLVFVHARDRFGNIRGSGNDKFSMDPLMLASLHATQQYVGGGSYQLTYWWETRDPRVAYEVCPRSGSQTVAQLGQCLSRTDTGDDERSIAYLEATVVAANPVGYTSAHASTTTCLTVAQDTCGRAQATAGKPASFAIEARTASGAAHFGGQDAFLVTLDGPTHVAGQISHLRLNYYEVSYVATQSGDYDLSVTLLVDGKPLSLLKAPPTVRVFAASADPSKSTVVFDSARSVNDPIGIALTCRDVFGNNRDMVASASIRHEASGAVTTRRLDCLDGFGRVSLRSTASGTQLLRAHIESEGVPTDVSGSPSQVYLHPGPVDISHTTLESYENCSLADAHEIVLQARDEHGNSVDADDLDIFVHITASSGPLQSNRGARRYHASSLGSGSYRAHMDLNHAATRLAVVISILDTKSQHKVAIGPFDVDVTAGPVDLDTSTLDPGALRGAIAGEPLTFRALLRDTHGNSRTEPDHIELALLDQAGTVHTSVQGMTNATDWTSLPIVAGGCLEQNYILRTAGAYISRFRLNHVLEVSGPSIVVTFGAPGPARIFGWRAVDRGTVLAQVGDAEPFFVQSVDHFGNERAVDDLAVRVAISSDVRHTSGADCTASYFSETPGLYKVMFQCGSSGTYNMQVSTAIAQDSSQFVGAGRDDINTPHGVRLAVSPSSLDSGRSPPLWLVRPRWYRSAGPAVHNRRLQVEVDYAIELELQEEDLSALLGDDNANASALDSSLQSALDQRMAAAAALMTGEDFTSLLAENVNQAAAAMAQACTANAVEEECIAANCRYTEYLVSEIEWESDPQNITLQFPTTITEDTVMRIRPTADGDPECTITVSDAEGAVVTAADPLSGKVTFATPQDTTLQLHALANPLEQEVDPTHCVFTTCVANVTIEMYDSESIVNAAPNITELLASVVVETPAFSGTANMGGSALLGVVCGEPARITASVYDSFYNLQTAGSDEFDFQWVAKCQPEESNAQLAAVVDRCSAVDMSNDGETQCNLADGCKFSYGTPNPEGSTPTITFNSTTSEYYFDFMIRNCDGAVHFTLTVNGVNVTTESGLLVPRDIGCVPGVMSADFTEAFSRSQAADPACSDTEAGTPCVPLPVDVSMAAGERESIIFQARDLFNNEIFTGGEGHMLAFDITVPPHTGYPDPQTVRCGEPGADQVGLDCGVADFTNGEYQAEYQVRYRGRYTVDILVVDSGVETSIFGSQMYANVIQGGAVPALCELTYSSLSMEVGTSGTVAIQRFDSYGNTIPTEEHGTLQPEAYECGQQTGKCNQFYLLIGELPGPEPTTDPLELSYSSTVSGNVTITVWFRDDNGAPTPAGLPDQRSAVIEFVPSQPEYSKSLVVDGTQRTVDCIAGVPSAFVIQTRDQYENNCDRPFPIMPSNEPSQCPGPADVCAWSVQLTPCLGQTQEEQEACESEGILFEGTVTDSGDGQYTVGYTAPSTGFYKIRVRVTNTGQLSTSNELTSIGSPFVILSDTSAVASACQAIEAAGQTGLRATRAGALARFKLQANGIDANGDPVARRGSGEQFVISVEGDRTVLDSQTQDYEGLGVYQMQYAAHSTDHETLNWAFTVEVKLDGNHIDGSPFEGVEMTPADTAAPYSYADGRALATGTAGMTEVFEVVARDAYNNAATECAQDWSVFELQLTLSGEPAPTPLVRGCTAQPFARYEVEYRVTGAGEFSLEILFRVSGHAESVSGSPHAITVGSSSVSAASSFIALSGEYRDDIDSGLTPATPAATGNFDTLDAGEVYTFFVHAFDEFHNRLTQNICAGETGTETVSCLDFAFRWCQLERDLGTVDAGTCHTNVAEPEPSASLTKERAEGSGVYRVQTAPGVSGLSRSGGYRVDVTIAQADGTIAALNNSYFLLAVDPAVASATGTDLQPPLTIMASQTVMFEMTAHDEFDNAVDQLSGGDSLQFTASFVCTLATGDNADCSTAGEGVVAPPITYEPTLNSYSVSITVDSGGNAASLLMTILLGGVEISQSAYAITVRAAQNEPSLCYVISPEAGTVEQRSNANSSTTDPALRGRDCHNLDHKVAGDSMSFVIQSVLRMGTDRAFQQWQSVCTPEQIASDNVECDRLDEFEVVAIHQVTQNQVGPFREDCANLCPEVDTNGTCPLYRESECISLGQYGISWNTTMAGDWLVTIRSLGVMIQTEPSCPDGSPRDLASDPPGACPDTLLNADSRVARFDKENLLNTGYLVQQDLVLASFVTHIYPAAMSADTSLFELTTLCEASTPCVVVGSEYDVTVTAKDQYGNHLEEETDAQGQVCAIADCLAVRLRATLQTECADDPHGLCTVQSSAFAYDADDDYPGHLRATVIPVVAGMAKLQVELLSSGSWVEFSCGKLAAVVRFGVAPPTPNSGFTEAGDDMHVEAAIYGFLDPPPNITPEFSCEWVGDRVGGVHRTAATLLDESRPSSTTIELTIEGGGAGISWELECKSATTGSWDLILSGGINSVYDEFSPCREDVEALHNVARALLADDPRQVDVVDDWTVATCSSALDTLQKYGLSCDVEDGAVAEVCPIACDRCTSHNASTLRVTTDIHGDCRLKPVLEEADVGDGSTPPSLTVSAQDRFVTLLPEQTLVATPGPLEFTVVGLRKLTCDGGPPTVNEKTQALFKVSAQYTAAADPDFANFEAGQSGSLRDYASFNDEVFSFYEDPVVSELKVSTNAELYPGRPLFTADAGRRALQVALPDYGGDVVFVPATHVGDTYIPTLLSIVAVELDNGAEADKTGFECMFRGLNNSLELRHSATYLSDTELECATPDFAGAVAGLYAILLSKNGQHFSPTGKVIQTFSATQISPTFAAVQGLDEVEIELSNGFSSASLNTVFCRFGDWLWPDTAVDRNAPDAGPSPRQPTNVLHEIPFGGSVGDVVAATWVADGSREVWKCPVPEIQDDKAIKDRNIETAVRVSYDGKSWTNAVNLFYFDQPDVREGELRFRISPPVGPTGGGTAITVHLSGANVDGPNTVAGTPRDYYLRADEFAARCRFMELSDVVEYEDDDGEMKEANDNATIVVDSQNALSLRCTTPPNPQPGSNYDLDISLDGGLTWSYWDDSSSGRQYPTPPTFSYYAETAVITRDAASNYDSTNYFRGRIERNDSEVDVRFQYSCGYTTSYRLLAKCKFGDLPPSHATLEAGGIGATGINQLTCAVPLQSTTGIVDLSISLNGVDFTALRAGDTTFVYFGEAVALRAWWQADASASASRVGTPGHTAGTTQVGTDDPPTLSKKAQRLTDLEVVRVEIIDDQGSFVSEDPRKGATIFIELVQLRNGNAPELQELTLTVGKGGLQRDNPDAAPGDVFNENLISMSMDGMRPGDTIWDAPGVGDVAPQPGTTMFVGLQMSTPEDGNYEVWLDMRQNDADDCNGCSNPSLNEQTGCGCEDIGCCLAGAGRNTWHDAIAADIMTPIPQFRLGLTILVGDTSVVDTDVPTSPAELQLAITPMQAFKVTLMTKDSAGNNRPEGGDTFQMRIYLQEGEVACGAYVMPSDPDAKETLSVPEARDWCGSAACGANQVVETGVDGCAESYNRAKRIQTFEETCLASTGKPRDCVLTKASDTASGRCDPSASCILCTCTYRPERLVCTDEFGNPLCQQYDPNERKTFVARDGSTEEVDGIGGALTPGVGGVFAAEDFQTGVYQLSSGLLTAQEVTVDGAKVSLRLYGTYVIAIEGNDPNANVTTSNVIGGQPWVEINDSPQYGRMDTVDCSAIFNENPLYTDPLSPLTGGLTAPLIGSISDAEGKRCLCVAGYEKNNEYTVRATPEDPVSSGLLPGQVVCKPCNKGYYKPGPPSNELTCQPCPVTTTTLSGRCREKIRAVSSSNEDNGYESSFGDLTINDAEWRVTHHDLLGETDCVEDDESTWHSCRRGNPQWQSDKTDARACEGVTNQGFRGNSAVPNADKATCEMLPTHITSHLNETDQIQACVYEPSLCERGECTSKDVCMCQDRHYDFRNIYLVCQKTEWFRLEASKDRMDSGGGTPGLRTLDKAGTYCATCPDCVKCYENGTIVLESEYWTFDEGMKMPAPYYWENWEVPLRSEPQDDPECPLDDPHRCPAARDDVKCPDNKCIYVGDERSKSYKHWMITAYKCLHSPGGVGAPTCLGGDWELAKVGQDHRDAKVYPGTTVACSTAELDLPKGTRPGCDFVPQPADDPAGAKYSNGFCLPGSAGTTCAVCGKGYKQDKGGEGCASCEEQEQADAERDTNWGAAFLLFLTTIIVIGLFIFAIKRAKTEDILKIKILIAFGQVMQSFATTYSITWPPVIASFIDQFSIVSFDLFTIGSIECVDAMRWVKTFFAQFSFMVIAPLACIALLFLGYKVSTFRDKRARADQGKQSLLEQKIQTIEIQGAWASRGFFLLILIYLKVSATVLEMFRCRKFEPYPPVWGDHPERNEASSVHQITEDIAWKPDQEDGWLGDGRVPSDFTDREGLEKDMLFTCTENTYILFKAFAVAMLIVYPIGIPAFFLGLMFRERDQISDAINQKKFGFLFADYVTMYFMWEILDLMRKLLLSGLMIFFNRGSVGQLLAGMVVALTFLEAQLRLMPYNDLLANIVQIVAFNAIFLNLLGALLTKVKFEDGIDSSLSADFANHFLIFVNVSVPICVLFMLAFSVGYDMYLISIGKMIKGGLAGKSRAALLDAIGMRKENRKKNAKKKNNVAETGFMALYHLLWKREDVDEALLSEELAYLDKRRDERDKAIILFRQAQVHHEEKREWYRFVYNHTKTEEEFNEIVQTESLASYKRLMLGLEEDMEDDIHERVTREIVQASNVASDEEDDDFANPVYADADDTKGSESGSGKKSRDAVDAMAIAPAKKDKKKKKKKTSSSQNDDEEWFGNEADTKKNKKKSAGTKSTEDELAAAQAEIAALEASENPDPTGDSSKKKKKKKKSKGVVGTDPTADFDILDDEDPTAADFDIEPSGSKKKKKKKKKG